MKYSEFKVGQRVRVTAHRGGLFSSEFERAVGVVVSFNEHHVTCSFDGEEDYGQLDDVELVADVAPVSSNVKEAIANVEAALATLKALVG